MEYTNDDLEKMDKRLVDNKKYGRYFKRIYSELGGKYDKDIGYYKVDSNGEFFEPNSPDAKEIYKYINKSDNISNCLNYWEWDKYEVNKLLDLQRVNRCKDNRFCPNCKCYESSKFIHKIRPIYENLLNEGKHFYFLTLTIPSIDTLEPQELKETVDKLYKSFSQFKDLFSKDLNSKKSYHNRSVQFDGGIRVLEITHNDFAGFHPHLHCIIVVDDEIDKELLEPKYKARWSKKRKSYDYKSELEIELTKVWMLCFNNIFSQSNMLFKYDCSQDYSFVGNIQIKNLEINFRELDEKGFFEIFKYTVKSSEIKNYQIFKCLYFSLYRRRIRQGFGCLYNLKIDNCADDDGELQLLHLETPENPTKLINYEIKELFTVYSNYKKISRFNGSIDRDKNISFKIKD